METNFKVNLNPSQWQQAAKLISYMAKYSFASISYENYADAYNIRSLLKKIMIRMFNKIGDRHLIKMTFTPNEIRSLRYLCGDNRDILSNLKYEETIFTEISAQVNKQEVKLFTLQHYAINTNF